MIEQDELKAILADVMKEREENLLIELGKKAKVNVAVIEGCPFFRTEYAAEYMQISIQKFRALVKELKVEEYMIASVSKVKYYKKTDLDKLFKKVI